MTPQEALVRVIEHREIFHEEMLSLMRQIMSGEISPTLIGAITIGLRVPPRWLATCLPHWNGVLPAHAHAAL